MALIKINNRSSEDTAIHGRRNILINGAMQVAQRGTSFTSHSDGYTLDRMRVYRNGSQDFTVTQESDGPANTGFTKSIKIQTTTADATLDSTDYSILQYNIEGQDLQQLQYGSSGAKSTTMSFWVKSNMTGNMSITNEVNIGPPYAGQYITINSADTWEYKTITFPGNTSTSIDNDNSTGIEFQFWLSAGTGFSNGTYNNTTWHNNTNDRVISSNINIQNSTSNYIQFTGLQFEVGDTATPFEHRSFGEELALCQRYYYAFINSGSGNEAWITTATSYNSSNAYGGVRFPVTMRAVPSLRQYTGTDVWQYYNNNQSDRFDSFTIFGANQTTTSAAMIYNNDVMSITAGQSGNYQGGNASCYMHFDAEL